MVFKEDLRYSDQIDKPKPKKEKERKSRKSTRKSEKGGSSASKSRRSTLNIENEEFTDNCMNIANTAEWDQLEDICLDELDATSGNSDRAYFFLGISLYKQEYFSQAVVAFTKSIYLKPDDA